MRQDGREAFAFGEAVVHRPSVLVTADAARRRRLNGGGLKTRKAWYGCGLKGRLSNCCGSIRDVPGIVGREKVEGSDHRDVRERAEQTIAMMDNYGVQPDGRMFEIDEMWMTCEQPRPAAWLFHAIGQVRSRAQWCGAPAVHRRVARDFGHAAVRSPHTASPAFSPAPQPPHPRGLYPYSFVNGANQASFSWAMSQSMMSVP